MLSSCLSSSNSTITLTVLHVNLAPIDGLDSAILRTKAAVDDTLFTLLDAAEHGQVVAG